MRYDEESMVDIPTTVLHFLRNFSSEQGYAGRRIVIMKNSFGALISFVKLAAVSTH
jgi:hypothetical protein